MYFVIISVYSKCTADFVENRQELVFVLGRIRHSIVRDSFAQHAGFHLICHIAHIDIAVAASTSLKLSGFH